MDRKPIVWVYIVKPSLQEIYKIGCTRNVDARLRDLQVANFDKLEVVHKFETKEALIAEQLLHKLFENKKVRGEWYQLDSLDIAFLCRINGYANSFTWDAQTINLDDIDINSPEMFSIFVENIPTAQGLQTIQFTETQIRKFLNTIERRELQGKLGLSRTYWTKQHRPRLKTYTYNAMIKLLCDNGLILNRNQGRSGNMALSASQCFTQIKSSVSKPST